MTVKVLGLIELQDSSAFERYRQAVGATVEHHGGQICSRGQLGTLFWNELQCAPFSAYVELQFPTAEAAQTWVNSPHYQALVPIRSQAMKLTLFSVLPT